MLSWRNKGQGPFRGRGRSFSQQPNLATAKKKRGTETKTTGRLGEKERKGGEERTRRVEGRKNEKKRYLDHALEHFGDERALELRLRLRVEVVFLLLQIPDHQLVVRHALPGAQLVVVDAPHQQVEHGHVLVVLDLRAATRRRGGCSGSGGSVRIPVVVVVVAVRIGIGHWGIAVLVPALVVLVAAWHGFVLVAHVDVVLLHADDALSQQAEGLAHEIGRDVVHAVRLGDGFAQPDHALQLPDRDAVTVPSDPPLRVVGPELFVLFHQQRLGLGCEFRPEGSCKANVPLQLLRGELGRHGVVS